MGRLGALVSSVTFDPKITFGNIMTLLGGMLAVAVVALTLYVEFGIMKAQLSETRLDQIKVSQGVARLQAQMEILLLERKHAAR
jgi:hypothetical protein